MMTNRRVDLTKEQEACVNYKGGDLLVKGVAGSGKSYVILKRALKLFNESHDTASIKIFTYTNILVKYSDELLQNKMGGKFIDVSTVDSYFMQIYKTMFRRFPFIKDEKTLEIIDKVLLNHRKKGKKRHRFYSLSNDFWMEEFNWIQEKCIFAEDDYIKTSRKGRGSEIKIVSEIDKKLVWSLYELFCQEMKKAKCNTWPEVYLRINENIDKIPDKFKIDYVFIDEAQDLTIGKLRALKAITKKTITIAADMAQKIYKTTFTWKEVGIDIQGRASKTLKKSFRSTKQIVMLAEDLALSNRKNVDLKDELTEAVFPDKEGDIPILFTFKNNIQEEVFLVKFIEGLLQKFQDETIGIICKTKKYFFQVRAILNKAGIDFQEVLHSKKDAPKWSLLEPGLKIVIAKSSKGLEFDTVLIPKFEEGIYPFTPTIVDKEQENDFLATERNLLYVAMTRARQRLFMFCTENNKSRFVDEFLPEHYNKSFIQVG